MELVWDLEGALKWGVVAPQRAEAHRPPTPTSSSASAPVACGGGAVVLGSAGCVASTTLGVWLFGGRKHAAKYKTKQRASSSSGCRSGCPESSIPLSTSGHTSAVTLPVGWLWDLCFSQGRPHRAPAPSSPGAAPPVSHTSSTPRPPSLTPPPLPAMALKSLLMLAALASAMGQSLNASTSSDAGSNMTQCAFPFPAAGPGLGAPVPKKPARLSVDLRRPAGVRSSHSICPPGWRPSRPARPTRAQSSRQPRRAPPPASPPGTP